MTNKVQDVPMLSPLYSTALSPTSAFPTDGTPRTPSRPPLSSPALYTPTEAVGILLGQSPKEAAQTTRMAIEAAAATSNQFLLSPFTKYQSYSTPCSPICASSRIKYQVEVTNNGKSWHDHPLGSLSHHHDDFNLDIDTAALATEVALKVLTPADCFDEQDESEQVRKLRLILPWDQDQLLTRHLITTLDSPSSTTTAPEEPQLETIVKPPRKGRARMSQEKRKRLARRKEREAMLLGIPPKPISAPPHMSHFPSLAHGKPNPSASAWKQSPKKPWTAQEGPSSKQRHFSLLSRSASSSEETSSRRSISSVPSLVGDDGNHSSQSASPSTSPECTNQRARLPVLRVDQAGPLWATNYQQDSPVPRFSLQPPSPQQVRMMNQRRQSSSLMTSTSTTTSPPSVMVAPPMMRWSTAQGLMTNQGVVVTSPRAAANIWPPTFSNQDLGPTSFPRP